MTGGKDKGGPTIPIRLAEGNPLFEKTVAALALDEGTIRWMLVSVLNTIGSTPQKLNPDELGTLLPEIDRRLRKLVPDTQADPAIRRVYHLLFEHTEP